MHQKKIKKIFVSHGHNELLKLKLKNFIVDRLGLQPIILSEQPDLGLTVIEKLEKYGKDCDFALIVFTADDKTISGGARARQNVIHELGFFHGILGRDRVLLLKQKEVELFSNISGLIYKEFTNNNIESIFEDIRIAIENDSALSRGEVIQIKLDNDVTKAAGRMLDTLFEDAKKGKEKLLDGLKKDINQAVKGFPQGQHIKRIKWFLEQERKKRFEEFVKVETQLHEFQEKINEDNKYFSLSALALAYYADLKYYIDILDMILDEISFAESQKDILEVEPFTNRIYELLEEQRQAIT